MTKSIVVDSSFLINMAILNWLDVLCQVYEEIIVTPTVEKECERIKSKLDSMSCVKYIHLSGRENEMVSKLLGEMELKFPGEHRGEVESLVVANSRGIPMLISDNFAPWYLKSKHSEIPAEVERGYYVVAKALEINALKKEDMEDILKKMKGTYPKKAIDAIKERFGGG